MSKLKICIIGNSHTGCFRTGWNLISEYYPEVEMTFYPYFSLFYKYFTPVPEEGFLRMDNNFIRNRFVQISGGDGNIRFDEFDICLIIGATLPWRIAQSNYSQQVIKKAGFDFFEESYTHHLITKIRVLSDIPIECVFNPFKAFRDVSTAPIVRANYHESIQVLNDIIQPLYNAKILPQPEETVLQPFVSKLEFAAGEHLTRASKEPGAPQVIDDDMRHMNRAYGAVFITKILSNYGIVNKDVVLPEPDGHILFSERNFEYGI